MKISIDGKGLVPSDNIFVERIWQYGEVRRGVHLKALRRALSETRRGLE